MEFHHIGVACRSIELERKKLKSLGYVPEGEPFYDPIQAVHGLFLSGGGPRLELLASDGTKGVLRPWLNSRVKMYHLAYTCSDLEKEIAHFRKSGAKVVVKPVPSSAYNGNPICFLMLPNMLLIEIISID